MSAASSLVVAVTCVLSSLASGGRILLLLSSSNRSTPSLVEAALLLNFPGEASENSTAVQGSNLDVLLHPVQDQVLVTGASAWQDPPVKEEAETVDASTREVITSLPPSTPVLQIGLDQSASRPREAIVRHQAQAPPHLNSFAQKAAAVSEALRERKTASQPLRQDHYHLHEHHEDTPRG